MYTHVHRPVALIIHRQKTPLHCALEVGHVDVLELLVKHGAKVSLVKIGIYSVSTSGGSIAVHV